MWRWGRPSRPAFRAQGCPVCALPSRRTSTSMCASVESALYASMSAPPTAAMMFCRIQYSASVSRRESSTLSRAKIDQKAVGGTGSTPAAKSATQSLCNASARGGQVRRVYGRERYPDESLLAVSYRAMPAYAGMIPWKTCLLKCLHVRMCNAPQ